VTSSNDPRFDPNPNTGKPLRADGETRPARNAIHHDAAHPSRVLLPVTRVYGPGKTF
jgi:predicted acyl esterase